jgi:predicted alpha/beta-fold hydrolase
VIPFRPLFRNPHLQTCAGHYWRRPNAAARFPVRRWECATEPGVRVVIDSQQPDREPAGHVVLVHGLEGASDAGYMVSLAAAALDAGYAAHRVNIRGCGAGAGLANTLYHGGLTTDLRAVLREIGTPVFLIGFSLGANIVLKLAGELGDAGPTLIRGVCGVSSPLDLEACCRRISQPDNRIYERRFVNRMRARLLATGRYSARDLGSYRSLLAIDDCITAPSFGLLNACNYYQTQSAIGFVPSIRVPALLIQALDDTFIPFAIFDSAAVRSNPAVTVLATPHGGHLGFLGRSPHRFWADHAILDWITGLS